MKNKNKNAHKIANTNNKVGRVKSMGVIDLVTYTKHSDPPYGGAYSGETQISTQK